MNAEETQNPEVATNLPNDGVIETPATPPGKRGRGRPAKASDILTAAEVPEGSAPKVEKPKPRAKKSEANALDLGQNLVGIHHMIVMVTGMPEMAIHEKEGEALAKGILAISEEYGLALDGKTGASLQFFGALAMIYGPRVYAIRQRITQQKNAAAQLQAAQIETPAPLSGMEQMLSPEFAGKAG